jgi:membrane protein
MRNTGAVQGSAPDAGEGAGTTARAGGRRSAASNKGPVVKSLLAALDRWQRHRPVAAFPIAVTKKFGEDRASSLAALIAYYAFFSLFPLLLAFVAILGFVLEGDESLQRDIVDSALARIPVIGPQLSGNVGSLTGSGVALAVGLGVALWAGLAVTLALGRAFDEIWDVPRLDQRGTLSARARGAAVLVVMGVALIGSSVLTGLAIGGGIGGDAAKVGAVAGTAAVNALVYFAVFGLLTARPFRPRELWPGVAVATVGSLVLQAVGGWYVDRTVNRASETYGTFALVIGLLSWFWLGSQLFLLAAEVNVVRARRLWPRSLAGELEPADVAALRRAAQAARQDPRQRIVVSFEESGDPGGPPR